MSKVTVRIRRYNPAVDAAPQLNTYEVPWKEYLTGLQALHYINDYIEPVAFDYSCRGGLCGRCGIMINGKPGLSCYSVLDEGGEYVFEPLAGMPVIRDLVVDKSGYMEGLISANAEPTVAGAVNLDELPKLDYDFWWEDLHRKNMCRECGLCFAACPAYQQNKRSYAGPAVLAQVYLRAFDGLDKSDRVLQAVNLGVFNCTLCGDCNLVCPSYIDHVACNEKLQNAAREAGLLA